jgi:AbiV family abortive infection protein
MPQPVSAAFLLKGAVYALEQCGLLLRDASILYRSRSYASAVTLAAFAREELGRSIILFELRKEATQGKEITVEDINKRCNQHMAKQEAGIGGIVIKDDPRVREFIEATTKDPQGTDWRKAYEEMESIVDRHKAQAPGKRHRTRLDALYVYPKSDSRWNRPADLSADAAQDFLQDAVNAYATPYHQRYLTPQGAELLRSIEPELYAALEGWSDRPELWPPEWPGRHAASKRGWHHNHVGSHAAVVLCDDRVNEERPHDA